MINIGCASVHPEDISFLSSDPVRELLADMNLVIEPVTIPLENTSVDVLFADADNLNKQLAAIDLDARPWVLISSKKADALTAWQLGASYFLLRPFSLEELRRALGRACQSYYWKKQGAAVLSRNRKLELQLTKGRKISVPPNDILFFEAQGEVTCVYLRDANQEKIVAMRNLGFWEHLLEAGIFIRVHKKFLVNIAQISALHPDEVQVQHFSLPVAKRRRKEVEKAFFSHQLLHGADKNGASPDW